MEHQILISLYDIWFGLDVSVSLFQIPIFWLSNSCWTWVPTISSTFKSLQYIVNISSPLSLWPLLMFQGFLYAGSSDITAIPTNLSSLWGKNISWYSERKRGGRIWFLWGQPCQPEENPFPPNSLSITLDNI